MISNVIYVLWAICVVVVCVLSCFLLILKMSVQNLCYQTCFIIFI